MKLKVIPLIALVLAALPVAVPATAQTSVLRPILVQNFCNRAVNLWVNHADSWHNWHSHGDFFIPANSSRYLEDYGVRLNQRTDHDIYFYAEATNGSLTWEGYEYLNVNGYTLPMRRQGFILSNGAYAIQLTC